MACERDVMQNLIDGPASWAGSHCRASAAISNQGKTAALAAAIAEVTSRCVDIGSITKGQKKSGSKNLRARSYVNPFTKA
jgi:hypothetical protein